MQSTAIYENRQHDKKLVEIRFPALLEFPTGQKVSFRSGTKEVASQYQRVVYGDHGPYIEFKVEDFCLPLRDKFTNRAPDLVVPEKPKYFYNWLYVPGTTISKVYFQYKTVQFLKNAPAREDGKPSRFNRVEGYADYKVGYLYVDPFLFDTIEVVNA